MTTRKPRKPRKPTQATIDFDNIIIEMDQLSKRRQTWEDGLLKAADTELYKILERCSSLHERLLPHASLKSKLTKALERRNTKQTAGSSLQLKVVRYVFGECGQEFTYARTLKAAHDSKPKDVPFVEWLASQGGPSGVKKGKATKQKQTRDLVTAAKLHYGLAAPLTTVPPVADLRPNSDADHHFAVALLRINEEGVIELVFGCNNIALTNQVLELAGKSVSPTVRQQLLLADNDEDFSLTLTPLKSGAAA